MESGEDASVSYTLRKKLAPHGLSLDDLRAPVFTLRPEQRASLARM